MKDRAESNAELSNLLWVVLFMAIVWAYDAFPVCLSELCVIVNIQCWALMRKEICMVSTHELFHFSHLQ